MSSAATQQAGHGWTLTEAPREGQVAPEWAKRRLDRAADEHPGRREGEVGISTITWDPKLTNAKLNGGEIPPAEGSRLARGTFLHWELYGSAPHRETEVRIPVQGTDLYLVGHIDAADPTLEALRDLKTTDQWDLTEERLEEVRRQLGLYGYAMVHGEANAGTHEDPNWVPAVDYFGFVPRRALMDLWPAGDIEWGRLDIQGEAFLELIDTAYGWACQNICEMVAGTWQPNDHDEPSEVPDLAPEEVHHEIREAGQLKDVIDEAQPRYDELRDVIYENLTDTARAGDYKAVYTSSSTEQVLDMDRVRAELDQAGLDLAEFQFTEFSVDVDDPAALAHILEEFDIDEEIAGVSIDKSPALLEEKLKARLAELDVLEACLEEQTTRSGYVSIRRIE